MNTAVKKSRINKRKKGTKPDGNGGVLQRFENSEGAHAEKHSSRGVQEMTKVAGKNK